MTFIGWSDKGGHVQETRHRPSPAKTIAFCTGWTTIGRGNEYCKYRPMLKTEETTPNARMRTKQIETIFLDYEFTPYGALSYFLTYYEWQFSGKCFTTLCSFLGIEKMKKTVYHLQTNGQENSIIAQWRKDYNITYSSSRPIDISTSRQ